MEHRLIRCAGEALNLYADNAVFWATRKTLLVADPHLGKAAAFRHAGIPVPEQVTHTDLTRLSRLLRETCADRLIVLGDLFHARTGLSEVTLDAFRCWRMEHRELEILLTLGNHDRAILPFPSDWRITIEAEVCEPPFFFAHERKDVPAKFGWFGHVHPAISCVGKRLPCFHLSSGSALLPAFGSFTGTHPIRPRRSDQVFALTGDEIIEIPPRLFSF